MYGLLTLSLAAGLIAGGQLMFKLASARMTGGSNDRGLIEFAATALSQPYLWIGGLFAAVGFVTYVYGLRLVDLSRAVPFTGGLIIVMTALLSAAILREPIGLVRALGIVAVVVGIALVARS